MSQRRAADDGEIVFLVSRITHLLAGCSSFIVFLLSAFFLISRSEKKGEKKIVKPGTSARRL
jgi:hypothetical protein